MTRGESFVVAVLIAALIGLTGGLAEAQLLIAKESAPDVINLVKVKIQLVSDVFVKELKGVNASFAMGEDARKYRGLILTLKVEKPAGESVTLNAQDLVLHYRYGEKSDIAPCNGVSAFSVQRDLDRPMRLFRRGRGGSSTGASTIRATEVYVDLFFQYMEPDTSDLHLLVAQPIGASFKSKGWK
mgnify:CR=1 FL=1